MTQTARATANKLDREQAEKIKNVKDATGWDTERRYHYTTKGSEKYIHVEVENVDENHFGLFSKMKHEGYAVSNVLFEDSTIIFERQ